MSTTAEYSFSRDFLVTVVMFGMLGAGMFPIYRGNAEREQRAQQEYALRQVNSLARTLYDNSHDTDNTLGDHYLLSIRRECDTLKSLNEEYGENFPVPYREMMKHAGNTCAEIGKRSKANVLDHPYLVEASTSLFDSTNKADKLVNGERRKRELAEYEQTMKNAKNTVSAMSSWSTEK